MAFASGKSGAGAITRAASGRTLLTLAQSLLCGEEALMDLGLRGSRVLITGGSRGIGLAVADALGAEGAAVGWSPVTPPAWSRPRST